MGKEISKAEEQIGDALAVQIHSFEEGLNAVIEGGIEMGMEPIAMAVACSRSLVRIATAISISVGATNEKCEEMVLAMVNDSLQVMSEVVMTATLKMIEKDESKVA